MRSPVDYLNPDTLEERIGQADDVKREVDALLEELSKDPDGELEAVVEKATAIQEDLETASTVEKTEDFDINIINAHLHANELRELLKRLKIAAKSAQLSGTLDVIDEAAPLLKSILRDLAELLPES